jgi:hypothetical protein
MRGKTHVQYPDDETNGSDAYALEHSDAIAMSRDRIFRSFYSSIGGH